MYKRARLEFSSSYQLIALLSHARKAIEEPISQRVTGTYRYRDMQREVQRIMGAEMAMSHYIGNKEKLEYTAVVDLKEPIIWFHRTHA